MRLALREAERRSSHDDVPIGAVVVHEGEVIAAGRNERELRQDPTAHAEVLALREAAARALGAGGVLDATLYVTLEPCAMCAGAIVLARVPRVVFGTADPKAGAAGSVLDVLAEPRLNHRPDVVRRRAGRGVRGACCRASSPGAAERPARAPQTATLRDVTWRGGRAVECGGLENRYGRFTSIEGSNPSPSVLQRRSLAVEPNPRRWRPRCRLRQSASLVVTRGTSASHGASHGAGDSLRVRPDPRRAREDRGARGGVARGASAALAPVRAALLSAAL